MRVSRPRYASGVFFTAGTLNILAGSFAFLTPQVALRLVGVNRLDNPLFVDLSLWLVLVMGIGYCLVALNPERNRDLMFIGGLGKILVLPLALSAWGRGDIGVGGIVVGVTDFILALLFLDVMRRTRPASG
jgi:hypothetical membrane protein